MTVLNYIRKKFGLKLVYKYPKIVSKYCKGYGVEIGGASHSVFKFRAINVDISSHDKIEDCYTKEQLDKGNGIKKVDIIASGDNIPLADNSVDFVFSCHVLEHFYDPVAAINEWLRIVKPNKYVVCLIPHKDRTFDKNRDCTTIEEFVNRHNSYDKTLRYPDAHYSVWSTETFLEFAKYFDYNVVAYNDKLHALQNSFAVAIKKKPLCQKRRGEI